MCNRRLGRLQDSIELYSQSIIICNNYNKSWLSWSHAYYDLYHQQRLIERKNIDSGEKGQNYDLLPASLESVKMCIVCLLKALEYESQPAHMLLKRLIWLLHTTSTSSSTVHNSDPSTPNPRLEYIQTLCTLIITNSENVPVWKWLYIYNDIIQYEYNIYLLPILSKVTLLYPQAVLYTLISSSSSSALSKLSTENTVETKSVIDVLINELYEKGYEQLIYHMKTFIKSLSVSCMLSPLSILLVGIQAILQQLFRDETLIFLPPATENNTPASVLLLPHAYHELVVSYISKASPTFLGRPYTYNTSNTYTNNGDVQCREQILHMFSEEALKGVTVIEVRTLLYSIWLICIQILVHFNILISLFGVYHMYSLSSFALVLWTRSAPTPPPWMGR